MAFVLLGVMIGLLRNRDGTLSRIHRYVVNTHSQLCELLSIDIERVVSRSQLPRILASVNQAFDLPVMAGYEIEGNNNWRFGLQAGIGLNYLIGQKGRTLRDEITVVDFKATASGPYNRFFISGQCSPYLAYQLGENTQFRLHSQFRYQWHGTSPVYKLKHNSLILGGGVGLIFAL